MNNTTFPTSFCFQSWQTQKTYRKDRILLWCHNTMHISGTSWLPVLIKSIVSNQRSKTTCVGWWARSKVTDAIHAEYLELCHAVVPLQAEPESSEQLDSNRLISKEYRGPLQKIFRNWRFRLWKGFFFAFCIFLAFYFAPLQLGALEGSGFPCRLIVVLWPEARMFIVNITLFASYCICCPVCRFFPQNHLQLWRFCTNCNISTQLTLPMNRTIPQILPLPFWMCK